MDSKGRVPAGSVSDDLLEPDPHAPFGLRTDNDAAYRAFSDAWQQGGVVLVEGSDLLRADLYTDFLTDDQARRRSRPRCTGSTSSSVACSPTSIPRTTRCSW